MAALDTSVNDCVGLNIVLSTLSVPRQIKRLLSVQLLAALLFSSVLAIINIEWFLSALVGSTICLGSNVVLAYFAFRYQGARSAGLIVRSFMFGEVIKMVTVAGLFVVTLKSLQPVFPLALFGGYVFVLASAWLVPHVSNREFKN